MDIIGTLIAESLRAAVDATVTVPLTLRRIHRVAAGEPADAQPTVWTLIDFCCPADMADDLAQQLTAALLPGWFCDYATSTHKYVVYDSGVVHRYPRGDDAGRAEAVAHGRRMGIPEAQLDWRA